MSEDSTGNVDLPRMSIAKTITLHHEGIRINGENVPYYLTDDQPVAVEQLGANLAIVTVSFYAERFEVEEFPRAVSGVYIDNSNYQDPTSKP